MLESQNVREGPPSLWAIIGRSLPCFVRRCRIGRIGCALFSSNWYCLAHGRKEGRKGATAGHAAGTVMPTLPPPLLLALQYHHQHKQARSVSHPASRPMAMAQIAGRREKERETYQHQMRTAGRRRQRREPFFLSGQP